MEVKILLQLLSLFPKCLQLMLRLCLRISQGKGVGEVGLGWGNDVCLGVWVSEKGPSCCVRRVVEMLALAFGS